MLNYRKVACMPWVLYMTFSCMLVPFNLCHIFLGVANLWFQNLHRPFVFKLFLFVSFKFLFRTIKINNTRQYAVFQYSVISWLKKLFLTFCRFADTRIWSIYTNIPIYKFNKSYIKAVSFVYIEFK